MDNKSPSPFAINDELIDKYLIVKDKSQTTKKQHGSEIWNILTKFNTILCE